MTRFRMAFPASILLFTLSIPPQDNRFLRTQTQPSLRAWGRRISSNSRRGTLRHRVAAGADG